MGDFHAFGKVACCMEVDVVACLLHVDTVKASDETELFNGDCHLGAVLETIKMMMLLLITGCNCY